MLSRALEQSDKEIIEAEKAFSVREAAGISDSLARRILLREDDGRSAHKFGEASAHGELTGHQACDFLEGLSKQVDRQIRDLQKNPESPSLINNVGVALLNAGDHQRATEYFNKAQTIDPQFLPARTNLVRALVASGNLEAARAAGEELVSEVQDSPLPLSALAGVCSALGDHEGAIAHYSEIVARDGNDFAALYSRAIQHIMSRRIDRAISDLRRALSIEPRMAAAYNALGVCYLLQRSARKARRHLETAVAIEHSAEATCNLANAHVMAGSPEQARDVLETHITRWSNDWRAVELLATTLRSLGRYRECVRHLAGLAEAAEEVRPESRARTYNNLGVALVESHSVDSGTEWLEKSLAESDGQIAFHNLARVLLGNHRIAQARRLYEQYRDRFRDGFTVSFGARLEELEGNYAAAKALYREAVEIEPNSSYGYVGLSLILCDIDEDYHQSISILEGAADLFPHDMIVLNNLAYAHLMANDIRAARKLLDRAGAACESEFYLCATRGLLLLKEGMVAEGSRLYNQARQLTHNAEDKKLVEQKKRIELARHWLGQGQVKRARGLVRSAVQIQTQNRRYRVQAARLLRSLPVNA